jgi:acetyl-CoA carboxylase biotin carboxyl carrier protein
MTLDEIRQLIQLAQETGVAELEVERGENRARIRLGVVNYEIAAPAAPGRPVTNPSPAPGSAGTPVADATDPTLHIVKSPIVGTYYEAPSPGASPFVTAGDRVSPGKVLCIIESMKLMNEIESEVSGTIVAKLVENGHAVEYGEALFSVRLP